MDVSFNNVLEGTRQYFMGLPKASPSQAGGQAAWPALAPPVEGAPARSGAPARTSRPPSAAAAPRPPSEPLEPEPHIIHKATVMREALEKRRERPADCDRVSPPPHLIRRPSPPRRPDPPEPPARPPDRYVPTRPPDFYEPSHQTYRYDGEPARGISASAAASPQPPAARHGSQQSYARMSGSLPQHASTTRFRDGMTCSPPAQRYASPAPPIQQNDRVPPIHHPSPSPHHLPAPSPHRATPSDGRSAPYSPHRRPAEAAAYARLPTQYERPPSAPRKYDIQQAYPGYRPAQVAPQVREHRTELPHASQLQYKHLIDAALAPHYPSIRAPDRARPPDQTRPADAARLPSRPEYAGAVRVDPARPGTRYYYPGPPATVKAVSHSPSIPVPAPPVAAQRGASHRPLQMPKSSYEYSVPAGASQTSPARIPSKSTLASQQARMTVSVTSLVNQMNQTKQKRESPLDLSVKTVKNSADSSTAQEDADSSSIEPKEVSLPRRPSSSARLPSAGGHGYVSSHKVDFSPDFHSQYVDRSGGPQRGVAIAPPIPAARCNGSYEVRPRVDAYAAETRHLPYVEPDPKYSTAKQEYPMSRIDLTRPTVEERHLNKHSSSIRDDRHYIVDDGRKRLGGPIISNIPEKIVRYETWCSDSRIDRMSMAAREQHELMSRPVYSYSSHKRVEAYHSEQKRPAASSYRDNRYSYHPETSQRDSSEYNGQYLDRHKFPTERNVIQKHPSSRELHYPDHNGVPANKRVLSILRNSLETKQSGFVEPPRAPRHLPDLIVIDDSDDPAIEITDLTKENDYVANQNNNINSHVSKSVHLPKAIDSMLPNTEHRRKIDEIEPLGKSPENDVASRIRTKAELKVMPPSSQETARLEIKQEIIKIDNNTIFPDQPKTLPKSQKQHLFNQIREDNLRKESEKNDNTEITIPEIKSEPMNIDEIEKDAENLVKEENNLEQNQNQEQTNEIDLDWASACDSFVEQLKTTCPKKKSKRFIKLEDSLVSNKLNDDIIQNYPARQHDFISPTSIIIKQEPEDEIQDTVLDNGTLNFIPHANEDSVTKSAETSGIDVIKVEKMDVTEPIKIKEEIKEFECKTKNDDLESTDDDEPLIKSKLLKDKEKNEQQLKTQLLKDLSEKSAYVKLECCDELTKNNKRESINNKSNDNKNKIKSPMKLKSKTTGSDNKNSKKLETSSDSDSDDISLTSRLRTRKNTKSEDNKPLSLNKTTVKSPLNKKGSPSASNIATLRKHGFGDGSDFHPGWEEELYRYKRSLRMPARLIAIPRGRSNGPPFGRNTTALFNRGSTSLPDLDPTPLSPAPSSAPSAATDDCIARRQDKIPQDSDLESNSSFSILNRLHYDSEASTSTFSSTKAKAKRKSIIDVLIQKCSRKEVDKKKSSDDDKKNSKSSPNNDTKDKTKTKGSVCKDKENLEDTLNSDEGKKDSCDLKSSINNNNEIKTAEKKTQLKLKSRTRTDSKLLKQRMIEMFGDDRPASAPPPSCPDDEDEIVKEPKKKIEEANKLKPKNKKIIKDKFKRRPSSIRDGLRSTSLIKRSDAKGRLLRLKKRNNLMNSLASKKIKEFSIKKKDQKSPSTEEKEVIKPKPAPEATDGNRKRFKRLFGRRKLSSGFDYIRKKKKIIKKDENKNKIRKIIAKPTPECEDDILKEIKGWFINKSIGETSLHRATRLGYTDCVAYCLEKLDLDPSSKDNAGFTSLHVAAARGHVPIARLLLKYGANVSAAAQGGIRPLHEACENCHVEVIRLLLSYGADPLLGTYSGQTPSALAEGPAARLLRLHIADVQGRAGDPWQFQPISQIMDWDKIGCDPLSSPPPASPPPTEGSLEIQCTEAPLPPFYSLRGSPGQPVDGLWCLLQDITALLQIKSKDSLLKQIHCGSGSPKELLRELRTQEFLERAQCHQFLGSGEKVNVRASKVALVRVTDKLRQLLKIETVLVS